MKRTTQWLKRFAEEIKPEIYLEVGVNLAQTLNEIPANKVVGIDPNPNCKKHINRKDCKFYNMTSDQFANSLDYLALLGKVDMLFIDGLHTAKQVMQDIKNYEKLLTTDGWMFLHDTWPPDERHTMSDRCGDVFAVLPVLRSILSHRECEILTLPWCFGITIVHKTDGICRF